MNHILVSTVHHRNTENGNSLHLPELFYRLGWSANERRLCSSPDDFCRKPSYIGALYIFTLSICAGHSSTDAHGQASSGQACLPLLMPLQTAELDDCYRPY